MSSISLNFNDSSYSTTNKPTVPTLSGDLTSIENGVNDNNTRISSIESAYIKKDGSVASTALQSYATDLTPSDDKNFTSKKYVDDQISTNASSDGWLDVSYIPTRQSADDPTYVLRFTDDITSTIYVGMKLKVVQSTTKYFIVTAVGSYTTFVDVTVYGGTDYDVADTGATVISAVSYSTAKAPVGFPLLPSKWTVEVTDTTARTESTPSASTWYNTGAISIDVPIGAWDLSYNANIGCDRGSSTTQLDVYSTLSTANNSESDADFTQQTALRSSTSDTDLLFNPVQRSKSISVASKTTYYMNIKTEAASLASIYLRNAESKLIIRAKSIYL